MFPCVCVVNVRTRSFSLPKVLDFSLSLMEGCTRGVRSYNSWTSYLVWSLWYVNVCVCVVNARTRSFSLPKELKLSLSLMPFHEVLLQLMNNGKLYLPVLLRLLYILFLEKEFKLITSSRFQAKLELPVHLYMGWPSQYSVHKLFNALSPLFT